MHVVVIISIICGKVEISEDTEEVEQVGDSKKYKEVDGYRGVVEVAR